MTLDHRSNDFVPSEWDKNATHAATARKSGMKSALFMLDYSWNSGTPDLFVCADFSFRPWFGMNTKKGLGANRFGEHSCCIYCTRGYWKGNCITCSSSSL